MLTEAYQPYTISQITAQGPSQWRPGLGQPLYTKTSGTFWGVEFPAAVNSVNDGRLSCSYLVGKTLPAGKPYSTHSSVLGVSDSPDFVEDAFFDYIDRPRVRPLRLQTQYNSWFDYGSGVKADTFAKSVSLINDELTIQRGVPPLTAYVIDDGWQDGRADWSVTPWKVNSKFDPKFSNSHQVVAEAKSSLDLWLSPGCLFGAQGSISQMKKAGFRSLAPWMSMADPAYMGKLEERMVELASQRVSYFKLDRKFGLHPSGSKTNYHLTSPIAGSLQGLKAQYHYGDSLTLSLKPREIRILNFDPEKRHWKTLRKLQTRTKADFSTPQLPAQKANS